MNLDQLKTFQIVALSGSFTSAARKLFLTQPAVSQQIQALEASYGVKLFDRSGKAIHLTREGEMLLARTSKLIADIKEVEILFQEMSTLEKGRLEIAASAFFSTFYLPRPIGLFTSKYPAIEISLHTLNSHDVISLLVKNEAEFGFGGLVEDEPKVLSIPLHHEKMVAVVGNGHPLAAQETIPVEMFTSVPFIWRERGTQLREKVEKWIKGKAGLYAPKHFIELKNHETAKRLVEEGYGITIVPLSSVDKELKSGSLKQISLHNFDLTTSYYLHYPKGRRFSRAAATFLLLLQRTIYLTAGSSLNKLDLTD
ncbi:MAG: LysR substrate-binding domain-containing protein [Thermodesulfobacteriota bacterium]